MNKTLRWTVEVVAPTYRDVHEFNRRDAALWYWRMINAQVTRFAILRCEVTG